MPELDDIALLKQFAEKDSESAFAELVSQHVNLVYSTALRSVGNPHAAQEISQAVFIILARKANKLPQHAVLSGWLYQTTRLTAANHLRTEIRRQNREQEAYMQSVLNEPESEAWRQIAPLLDDAISKLGECDRNAVVLRFFENKNLREVGVALGASEDAAKMRVNRALEKLRKFFTKRGVALSGALIAGAVSANSVQAAPIGLAKTISAGAIAKGALTGSSTLALAKGTLKIMAWTKMKTIGVIGAAILLAGGATTVIVQKVVAQSSEPTIDESFWKPDSRVFKKAPPVLIIRPTKSDGKGASLEGDNGKTMLLNATVSGLLSAAYGVPESRMVLPNDMPDGRFDLMLTLPDHPREALQAEIKKRFGLVGHLETRDADNFALIIKSPNAPGLSRSSGAKGVSMSSSMRSMSIVGTLPPDVAAKIRSQNGGSSDQITMNNQTMSDFSRYLERQLGKQVVDQTETTNRYDFKLQVQMQNDETKEDALKRSLLEQLGLELVTSHDQVEMLVVEKMN